MFICEEGFRRHRLKHGKNEAVRFVADINTYTTLHLPNAKPKGKSALPRLNSLRTLFDCNEHFLETSNMGEKERSLSMILILLLLLVLSLPIGGLYSGLSHSELLSDHWYSELLNGGTLILGLSVFIYFIWPILFAPVLFTHLRARYRFNRTTRKVYVLRPARYGGNVILDWDRVMAHPKWCAAREMKPERLHDEVARQQRQENGGGPFMVRGLVLYWPPLDPDDAERKGEEVLWVGPKLAGENLWQYIRTFMEEGIDAVPVPNEFEWLRKGFHTPPQHIDETEISSARALGRIRGRDDDSLETQASLLAALVWAPLHCLGERLCKWPTFPEEWNSDCGQKRRENGIGSEEPLSWSPSLE